MNSPLDKQKKSSAIGRFQDLDMHDLGGILSWESPESMLRVTSSLVQINRHVVWTWAIHALCCSFRKVWLGKNKR